MRTLRNRFTKADYQALPEGFPAQLVEGHLVKEPAPTYGHQNLVTRLLLRLAPHVDPDLLVSAPTDVLVDDCNVFQSDLVVLHAPPPRSEHFVGTPRMAFEVLAAATASRDRDMKTPRLLALGVAEVWLLDEDARQIERHSRAGVVQAQGTTPLASDALPGFMLVPDTFFP